MKKTALIVFQKNEILGKVKTRLASTLGHEEALKIYQILIAHTHQVIQPVAADTYIFFSNYIPKTYEIKASSFYFQVQTGKDLGDRMKNAFEFLFCIGYERVLIIGTDCATLEPIHIKTAIQKLDLVDVVIGPAEDGGYYLLGMKNLVSSLFEDMKWSTEDVLKETINRLTQEGLSYERIETLSDVDREEDWDKVKMKFN
ncbi:MAG: rSAM/selenodomain-associated transferase 1 [Algoriphagus sp.]|jgi:rSAM/selenodomain-associated transferase 1